MHTLNIPDSQFNVVLTFDLLGRSNLTRPARRDFVNNRRIFTKLSNMVLLKKAQTSSKIIVREYQRRFQLRKSTIDQIFLLKQILKKCWEYNASFKEAYDRIDRKPTNNTLRADSGLRKGDGLELYIVLEYLNRTNRKPEGRRLRY